MLEPKFTLSWEGYQRNICNGLGLFQQNEDFVDMTLAADGHFVKVHQIIISLVSPYLKELIKSATCKHPVIFLNKMTYETLCSVLEYIYTGEVTVCKENLEELVEAGRELRIKGLENMGSSTLNSRINLSQPSEQANESTLEENNHDLNTSLTHEVYINDIDDTTIDDSHEDPIKEDTLFSTEGVGRTSIRLGRSVISKKQVTDISAPNDLIRSNPAIQYSVSNQGKVQIIVNRFIYYVRYTGKNSHDPRDIRRTWRCIDYNALKCSASVITKGNIVVGRTTAHTHPFHDKKIAKKVLQGAVFSAIMEAKQMGDSLKLNNTNRAS